MERNEIRKVKGISSVRRLPRLGKIRLGKMVESNKGILHPQEVPYFVCPDEVKRIYGEEPIQLDIMFPVEDEEIFFPQSYKWYGTNYNLKCKGNGEVAIRRWDDLDEKEKVKYQNGGEGGEKDPNRLIEVECPCERQNKECNLCGNLMVLLPKVSIGGVYQIDTGSYNNIININSFIEFLRAMTNGRVSLLPLKLKKVRQKMQYFDPTHKIKISEHYLLQLEPLVSFSDLKEIRKDKLMIPHLQIEKPREEFENNIKIKDEENENIKIKDENIPEFNGYPIGWKEEKDDSLTEINDNIRKKLENLLMEYCNNDKIKAQETLKELTSFNNYEGKSSLDDLSDKQVYVAYGKLKKKIKTETSTNRAKEFEEELQDEEQKRRIDLAFEVKNLREKLKIDDDFFKKIIANFGINPDEDLTVGDSRNVERLLSYLQQMEQEEINREEEIKTLPENNIKQKLGTLLMEYCNNDRMEAQELLKKLTTTDFYEGVSSLYALSEKQAYEVYKKLEDMIRKKREELLSEINDLKKDLNMDEEEFLDIMARFNIKSPDDLVYGDYKNVEKLLTYLKWNNK